MDKTTEKLKVKTSFGTLVAEKSGDSEYPGIYISLECDDTDENSYSQTLCLVEETFNDEEKILRLCNWRDELEDEDAEILCKYKTKEN